MLYIYIFIQPARGKKNSFIYTIKEYILYNMIIYYKYILWTQSHYTRVYQATEVYATKKRYENYIHKTLPTKIIATFLALIITLNNFVFNSKFYPQVKVCAVGTSCPPAYVIIFMAEFEQKYVYPLIKEINSFLTLYRWYFFWHGPNLKTTQIFYGLTESKTSLYKVPL